MSRNYNFKEVNTPMLRGEDAKAKIRDLLADEGTLFIKTQTTGLGKDARILTLTLMDAAGGWTQRLVNPGFQITDETTKYTGITAEDAESWESWEEGVAPDVAELFSGRTIAGWNVGFDTGIVNREQMFIAAPNAFEGVAGIWDCMELYSGAIGKDTRFSKFAEAIGKAAPADPVAYLEELIDLLKRVSA